MCFGSSTGSILPGWLTDSQSVLSWRLRDHAFAFECLASSLLIASAWQPLVAFPAPQSLLAEPMVEAC